MQERVKPRYLLLFYKVGFQQRDHCWAIAEGERIEGKDHPTLQPAEIPWKTVSVLLVAGKEWLGYIDRMQRMTSSIPLLFLVLLLGACGSNQHVSTEPTPGVSFQNPIVREDFPDPFILQVGDVFYAYATNANFRHVQVAKSTDLINWELLSDALPRVPRWASSMNGLTWAPEVIEVGDRYVLYYTSRDINSNKQCVGVAVSDQPEGPFTDTLGHPLVCQAEKGGTIDASPFRDGDALYLYFKNDGNCCGMPTRIYVQQLAADGLSVLGEPEALLVNDQPWEGNVIEAPTMFKHDGRYYLFFSANDYASAKYAVGYALCDSLTGPCRDAEENPILKSRTDQGPPVIGPGHQALLQVSNQTWIFYHAWETDAQGKQGDRRFLWMDRLDWVRGKPVVRGPTTAVQQVPAVK